MQPLSATSSLDRQQLDASRPTAEIAGSIPSTSRQARSPDQEIESNQAIIYKKGVIKFMDKGAILQEVPFRKEDVNSQAKEYADQGRKLSVEQGPYFVWQDCFDILTRTGKLAVVITTVVESRAGKRRRGEDWPERVQPATKEAFDFEMNKDEDEEEDEEEQL